MYVFKVIIAILKTSGGGYESSLGKNIMLVY